MSTTGKACQRSLGAAGDLSHGKVEGFLVGFRRFALATGLVHELQAGRADRCTGNTAVPEGILLTQRSAPT